MNDRFIRLRELTNLVSLSASTLRRQEAKGAFPKRIQLSPHAVAWRLAEVLAWAHGRPDVQGKDSIDHERDMPRTGAGSTQATARPQEPV